MKLQIGEILMEDISQSKSVYPYQNKTKKYLYPCVREYGKEFVDKINKAFKVAIGIGDIIVGSRGYKHEKHLFILFDTKVANTTKYFIEFLKWVKTQPMYEGDYVYGNIQKSTKHMIIIKFPEKYWSAFETFKIGNYSKMFNKDTIDNFFKDNIKIKKVLVKDYDYKFYFVPKLNKRYNSSIESDTYDGELDFPPTDQGEVFNHHLKRK